MIIGVVGCGLMGARRARTATEAGDRVVLVADVDRPRAEALAQEVGATVSTDWMELVESKGLDAVIVSSVNKFAMPIACAALENGNHVLCEKPLGRNAGEAAAIVESASRSGCMLKVGLNYRHHPGIGRAHEAAATGSVGELLAVRAVHGHGGRPGYDREWRGNAELAGGGELLDQGVHIVDLCCWFLGEFAAVAGSLATWVWRVDPLEDNAFALLRTARGQLATMHTSWTQWKNIFRFEVIGREGYLTVEGLGGSYGPERLTLGRRRPQGGVPYEETWPFDQEDVSWREEWAEFKRAIASGKPPLGSGEDGLRAARVLDAIYSASRTSGWVALTGDPR